MRHPRGSKLCIAILLVSILPNLALAQSVTTPEQPPDRTQQPAGPAMEVIKPSGGEIRAVEFRDAAGKLLRRIEASLQLTQDNGRRHIEEVKIRAVSHYVLVTASERWETGPDTRTQTGKVWEIHNTITLYDEHGDVLSQLGKAECFPVALSESGRWACLTSPPQYWQGPPAATQVYPPHDQLRVFSTRGEIVTTREEPRWQVQNVRLSPSGNWMAYVKTMAPSQHEIRLSNLDTARRVTIPVAEDRRMLFYQEVLDNGNLRAFEHLPVQRGGGKWETQRRPKTLYEMER